MFIWNIGTLPPSYTQYYSIASQKKPILISEFLIYILGSLYLRRWMYQIWLLLWNKWVCISMFHHAVFNSVIDKHQPMHFFTFKTLLV